jgi:hypothetical protein
MLARPLMARCSGASARKPSNTIDAVLAIEAFVTCAINTVFESVIFFGSFRGSRGWSAHCDHLRLV